MIRLVFAAAIAAALSFSVHAQTLFWDVGSWDNNTWAAAAGELTAGDRDGDGVPDVDDGFPDNPDASLDWDRDGQPEAWNTT